MNTTKFHALAHIDPTFNHMVAFMDTVNPPRAGAGRPPKYSHQDIAYAYFLMTTIALLNSAIKNDYTKSVSCFVSEDELFKKFKNFTYTKDGTKRAWYPLLRAKYPLYDVVTKGNSLSNRTSEVIFSYRRISNLTAILDHTYEETQYTDLVSKAIEKNAIHTKKIIPIDIPRLQNYLCKITENLRAVEGHAGSKMWRLYASAFNLLALANQEMAIDGNCGIPHYYTVSPHTNRTYYVGRYNLMSAPKEIRYAALGKCYEYDLETSIFAFFQKVANGKAETIGAYIRNKKETRKMLAECLVNNTNAYGFDHSLALIKTALTGISQGAQLTATGVYRQGDRWIRNSIAEAINNNDDYEKFITHPFITALLKDIKAVTEICVARVKTDSQYKHILNNDHFYDLRKKDSADDKYKQNSRFRLNAKRVMATLYQAYESEAMSLINEEHLIKVHDCIYTAKKLDLVALNNTISKFNSFATIGMTEINEENTDNAQNDEILYRSETSKLSPPLLHIQTEGDVRYTRARKYQRRSMGHDTARRRAPVHQDVNRTQSQLL
jgi:hypothetical protein